MTDPTQLPSTPAALRDLPLFTQPQASTPHAYRLAGDPAAPTTPDDPAAQTPAPRARLSARRSPTEHDTAWDWAMVRQLRTLVSERIAEERGTGADGAPITRLDRTLDGPLAEQLIADEITAAQARRINAGRIGLDQTDQEELTEAVLDAIFGLGRLEQFLHEDGLEDIVVRGCDNVWLIYGDGRKIPGPPAADTDEELIEDLQHLASTAPEGERAFSPATPLLDLSIGHEGHRLSATGWVVPRPTITIRRQGYTDISLTELVELGALDDIAAQFLSAAIQAGVSVIVSGLPSAGKTTMIRALLNELHPDVALATIETEYELALHHLPERHHNVWPAQYRPGGEDGAGEITLERLMYKSLRESVDRIVVGEVRGMEILPMFEAMQAGQGSVSTVHATSAKDTIERVVTLALKDGRVSADYAYRQLAASVDLVVNLAVLDETPLGGRKMRYLSEIGEPLPQGDAANGIGMDLIFAAGPDGRAVPTGLEPTFIDQLVMRGFDRTWLSSAMGRGAWSRPLPTLANSQSTREESS